MISTVLEYVSGERIAWNAHAFGLDVYHAWVLQPSTKGCHVLTEESQHGWLTTLSSFFLPNQMYNNHPLWLEGLEKKPTRPTTRHVSSPDIWTNNLVT